MKKRTNGFEAWLMVSWACVTDQSYFSSLSFYSFQSYLGVIGEVLIGIFLWKMRLRWIVCTYLGSTPWKKKVRFWNTLWWWCWNGKMTKRCWFYSSSFAFLGPIEIIWADFGPRKLNGIYGLSSSGFSYHSGFLFHFLAFSIISSHKFNWHEEEKERSFFK